MLVVNEGATDSSILGQKKKKRYIVLGTVITSMAESEEVSTEKDTHIHIPWLLLTHAEYTLGSGKRSLRTQSGRGSS